jgi:hypothetical protein
MYWGQLRRELMAIFKCEIFAGNSRVQAFAPVIELAAQSRRWIVQKRRSVRSEGAGQPR